MPSEFYSKLDSVDTLLERGPEEVAFDEDLAPLLQDGAVEQYFFEHVDGEEWLECLDENRALRPKQPDKRWPQAGFLKRAAEFAPSQTAQILLRILKQETPAVSGALLEIIVLLPGAIASQFLDYLVAWTSGEGWERRALEYASIIKRIVLAGENGRAFRVLRRVIELKEPDREYRTRPDPRIRPWQYEKILEEHLEVIFESAPLETWAVMCAALEDGIVRTIETTGNTAVRWRSAIENHEQNEPRDPVDLLLEAVRDSAERLLDEGRLSLDEVIEDLESRTGSIFDRLAMHLVHRHAPTQDDLVVDYILNREHFTSPTYHHEYYWLLRERFSELQTDQQSTILSWIEADLDPEDARQFLRRFKDEPIAESDIQEVIDNRRLRHLYPIREHLPPAEREEFKQLLEEHGEPEHPDFLSYSYGVRTGPVSPASATELSEFSVAELTQYLSQQAKPVAEIDEPSPLGLSRELSAVVAESPVEFAVEAMRFRNVEAIFVGAIFSGFADASGEEKEFDWEPVIRLCEWVLEQKFEYGSESTPYFERASDWSMARREMAGFLSRALQPDAASPPIELRDKVWDLLSSLLRDPDPAPAKATSASVDPATEAINTTRGKALHATFRYCWWVRKGLEASDDGGFSLQALTPNVAAELEYHLDIDKDSSLAIRAVYGQWFPSLVNLDFHWAEEHRDGIFPVDEDLLLYWHAAWVTYLTFWPVGETTYRLLREHYWIALDRLLNGDETDIPSPLADPEQKLASHILKAYWLGLLEDFSDEELLTEFWNRAEIDVRLEALDYVARSLRASQKEEIREDIIDRLKEFWVSRIESAQEDEPLARDEMQGFVRWFSTGTFEAGWAVDQLLMTLRVATKVPDFASHAIQHLAETGERKPEKALRCLELLAGGEFGIHAVRSEVDSAKRIILLAMQSGDEGLEKRATALLDSLARQGLRDELRDIGLLTEKP